MFARVSSCSEEILGWHSRGQRFDPAWLHQVSGQYQILLGDHRDRRAYQQCRESRAYRTFAHETGMSANPSPRAAEIVPNVTLALVPEQTKTHAATRAESG